MLALYESNPDECGAGPVGEEELVQCFSKSRAGPVVGIETEGILDLFGAGFFGLSERSRMIWHWHVGWSSRSGRDKDPNHDQKYWLLLSMSQGRVDSADRPG